MTEESAPTPVKTSAILMVAGLGFVMVSFGIGGALMTFPRSSHTLTGVLLLGAVIACFSLTLVVVVYSSKTSRARMATIYCLATIAIGRAPKG